MTQDVLDQLARLGYSTERELGQLRQMWQSEGEKFIRYFVKGLEDAAAEYERWLPQLQSFAAECRGAAPVPSLVKLTLAEQEQHRILLANMREFTASGDSQCVFNRKPFQAAILTTTRAGLAAAVDVFSGASAVILLEEEWERWRREVYPGVGEGFWWYARAWWTVQEGLEGWDEDIIRSEYPIPEGSIYWMVTSGLQWGSLAGGANRELWRWDGSIATSISVYCVESY